MQVHNWSATETIQHDMGKQIYAHSETAFASTLWICWCAYTIGDKAGRLYYTVKAWRINRQQQHIHLSCTAPFRYWVWIHHGAALVSSACRSNSHRSAGTGCAPFFIFSPQQARFTNAVFIFSPQRVQHHKKQPTRMKTQGVFINPSLTNL